MSEFKIGQRIVGNSYKPYFIADIAANHDGDINRAYKLIELAKEAGADAAKFQNFKASHIVSNNSFNAMREQMAHQASWKKSVFDVYSDATLPDWWSQLLKEKCDNVGIEYMTSPYDFENVDLADKYSNAFKIGSGDITFIDLIEHIAAKNKPVILATGASTIEDIERAVSAINKYKVPYAILQCNTNYTASLDNMSFINLNVLNTYKSMFPDAVLGLSDHTHGAQTVLGAIALGARIIEKHFTDDNSRVGPDHMFSMNFEAFKDMVNQSINLFSALGDGIKKIEENEKNSYIVQRRSLHYASSLSKGHVLKKEDIFPLRPICENSFFPYEQDLILGKPLLRDVEANTAVLKEDLFCD